MSLIDILILLLPLRSVNLYLKKLLLLNFVLLFMMLLILIVLIIRLQLLLMLFQKLLIITIVLMVTKIQMNLKNLTLIRSDLLTQKEMTLLCSYIYNNRCRLEEEVHQLQSNIRFRRIDVADCMELICSLQQLETFKEVTNHIMLLLKLK